MPIPLSINILLIIEFDSFFCMFTKWLLFSLWTCRITMTTATIMVQWKDTQNGQPLWLPAMDSSEDQGGREGGGAWQELEEDGEIFIKSL